MYLRMSCLYQIASLDAIGQWADGQKPSDLWKGNCPVYSIEISTGDHSPLKPGFINQRARPGLDHPSDQLSRNLSAAAGYDRAEKWCGTPFTAQSLDFFDGHFNFLAIDATGAGRCGQATQPGAQSARSGSSRKMTRRSNPRTMTWCRVPVEDSGRKAEGHRGEAGGLAQSDESGNVPTVAHRCACVSQTASSLRGRSTWCGLPSSIRGAAQPRPLAALVGRLL